MIITDFTLEHIAPAGKLAFAAYEEERRAVSALPAADVIAGFNAAADVGFADTVAESFNDRAVTAFADISGLSALAGNGMGAAAFEAGELIGFLCGTAPFDQAFRSTDVKGVFSPMGCNAARPENRGAIYAAMYQYAARKWVRAGAVSHAVCLYEHDEAAKQQFFRYGFGQRCADSIRLLEEFACVPCGEYEFVELAPTDFTLVYPLEVLLNRHYCNSPFFMNRRMVTLEKFLEICEKTEERYFIARYRGEVCAFLSISGSGETFITEIPGYQHVSGAFCLEEHRGKGVYQNLLNFVIRTLKREGYEYLGVDYESINPTANGFWRKYFAAYTCGVVRRIDERILGVE